MVNLVVTRGSPLQRSSKPMMKSPTSASSRLMLGKATTPDRVVPSPINLPYLRTNKPHPPLSPLTASESMFISAPDPIPGRIHSSDSTEERQDPPSGGSMSSNNKADELVCDYDQNVTQLYEMLESSRWEQARVRCRTRPQEVHTWIVRRDVNGNVRWKLLPLHAAVIFQAPLAVIEDILKEHPIAAAKKDDQGMLPIHLAFRHKTDESVIERLLQQYPSGVVVKDRRDRLPLDHGKDTQFSAQIMHLYSEAYAKCKDFGAEAGTDEKQQQNAHESRMSALKAAYEARIEALTKDHERAIQELNLKAERDAHNTQSLHNQEMDELRDLLSREVTSGEKTSRLEAQVRELSNSLKEANQESKVLRRVVHEQKNQQHILIAEIHGILNEHKTLHSFCSQQREQLDQAHQLREQLLRTLLQKEDGRPVRVSNEVCEMSSNILAHTEKLVKEAALVSDGHSKSAAMLENGVIAAAAAAAANITGNSDTAWGAHSNDEDEISAITENSNF